jgi:hypothetical protein
VKGLEPDVARAPDVLRSPSNPRARQLQPGNPSTPRAPCKLRALTPRAKRRPSVRMPQMWSRTLGWVNTWRLHRGIPGAKPAKPVACRAGALSFRLNVLPALGRQCFAHEYALLDALFMLDYRFCSVSNGVTACRAKRAREPSPEDRSPEGHCHRSATSGFVREARAAGRYVANSATAIQTIPVAST